jgi:hypothetical protein
MLDISKPTRDTDWPSNSRKNTSSAYAATILLVELYILIFFSVLAGYNLIYETTDSKEYSSFYSSITKLNEYYDNVLPLPVIEVIYAY